MGSVNTRPLVCGTPSARSAVACGARFSIEWLFIYTSNSQALLSILNTLTIMFGMKSELWHSPITIFFDREIVFIHLDSEEASLTPVGSPTVSSNPVLCPCFYISAPTNLEVSSNELLAFDVVRVYVCKCILCCIISPQI